MFQAMDSDLHHSAESLINAKLLVKNKVMSSDFPRLINRTKMLIKLSEALCSGSRRAIQKSKRLLETIETERASQRTAKRIRRSQQAKLNAGLRDESKIGNR